jgi:hypothetical protein
MMIFFFLQFQIKTSNPNNNLVKLVTYCYDANAKKVLFAHYKSYHSVFLNLQYQRNVGVQLGTDIKILKHQISAIDFYNFGPNPPKSSKNFGIGNKAPSQLIGFQYALSISQSRLNLFLEWRVLRQRNWKKYLDILRKITKNHIVEVGANCFASEFN